MIIPGFDFARNPLLVFWETTKACPLSCKHCRASAISGPLPDELTHEEGVDLIREIAGFGHPAPVLVLTGGDCLMRKDLIELVEEARKRKVKVALSPAVSDLITEETFVKLSELGVRSVSLSLDGSTADMHEGIRGVKGHFEDTLAAARKLVGMGFSVQINTTVMPANVEQLADIALILRNLGIRTWEIFFLVSVGRGETMEELTAAQNEDVCNFLADMTCYGFTVRTVEAPFYRRILAERNAGRGRDRQHGALYTFLRDRSRELLGEPDREMALSRLPTRDGSGIVFVAHNGDVYPSGFLPLAVGNVRDRSITEIYRRSESLMAIRNGQFSGKCGICEYRDSCGGSRSRAYSHTGDMLAEDPGCSYIPVTIGKGSVIASG